MTNDTDSSSSSVFNMPKGGLFSGAFDSTGLDANVRAVLMDFRWTTTLGGSLPATTISYFFPQQASDYTRVAGYTSATQIASFQPLTADQQAATRTTFDLVASYTNLKFVEASSGFAEDAAFRFARYSGNGSESNFPANNGSYSKSDSRDAGDTFLGSNGNAPAAFFGTDHFATIGHEMGHAFGLKHGHDGSYNGALAVRVNDNEFSIMTYASYLGSPTGAATEARVGSSPQSFMMYDIAALQALYGANFSKVGTTAVYKWDAVTGQQTVNGVAAPSTGITATNKIFSTIWTQGATTTYDFSNFAQNQVADLRPGQWSLFARDKLADLNSAAAADTPQFKAQGNIYNALLHNGDTRSQVGNIITGSGNDTITGNGANNRITAGAGNDTIDGGGGRDVVSGGAGADTINMTRSKVTLRDSLADMDDDIFIGADASDALDFTGIHASPSEITISRSGGVATIGIGGVTIDMNGDFSDGEFRIDARGQGDDAHTTVTFVSYLPTLTEGASVDADAINGVADLAFLFGDGAVGFTLDLQSAISAHSNTLGFYKVAADGTIFDVHVIFGNTLKAPLGTTIDLGTPGDGVQLGFFLIQDGFDQFGGLPDNLSFVTADGEAGNVDIALPVFLQSATLGVLSGAAVFHSFAELNPGGATQILSGVSAGDDELMIGFEDLPSASGDNDFQDVVIAIRATDDGNVIL
jgi:serralysin